MSTTNILDYTNLSCTNLMIKLKILVKKLPTGSSLHFYSTREQHENIKQPFSKKNFSFNSRFIEDNKYHIEIMKNGKT